MRGSDQFTLSGAVAKYPQPLHYRRFGVIVETIGSQRHYMPQIKKNSGASAGAIAALLVELGCSAADVTKVLSEMDVKKFLDHNGGFFGSIYDAHRPFNQYGIAPGDYFSS